MLSPFYISSACKPGSVVNGHQSLPYVATRLYRFSDMPPQNISCESSGIVLSGCCFKQGLQQTYVTIGVGELLPRLSILTHTGGLFLLHFPDGYPWLTLSVAFACEARTFLTRRPFGMTARDRLAELSYYYSTKCRFCQLQMTERL